MAILEEHFLVEKEKLEIVGNKFREVQKELDIIKIDKNSAVKIPSITQLLDQSEKILQKYRKKE